MFQSSMLSNFYVRVAVATAVFIGWHEVAVNAQSDQIFNLKGTPISGTVSSMTPDEVVMTVGGSDRKFPITEIKRLTFGDDPTELRRARDSVANGQLEAALEDLKKIDPDNLRREYVKQDYDFYKAFCHGKLALLGGAEKPAAVTQLRAFMTATKGTNYHAYEAAELLGDLAMSLESYDNALKFYAFLGRSSIPDNQLRAATLEGRALLAQNKPTEALQKFEGVISHITDDPAANRQKLFAAIGKAVCLAETGAGDEGLKLVEEIIAQNDSQDTQLFARAYNALGICHLKAKRPKDALLAFLHVDLLFSDQDDAHAEALYHLAKLWTDLNNLDRSIKARGTLTSRYAGSSWAKKQ